MPPESGERRAQTARRLDPEEARRREEIDNALDVIFSAGKVIGEQLRLQHIATKRLERLLAGEEVNHA